MTISNAAIDTLLSMDVEQLSHLLTLARQQQVARLEAQNPPPAPPAMPQGTTNLIAALNDQELANLVAWAERKVRRIYAQQAETAAHDELTRTST